MIERLLGRASLLQSGFRFAAFGVAGLFLALYALMGWALFQGQDTARSAQEKIDRYSRVVEVSKTRLEEVEKEFERVRSVVPPPTVKPTDVFLAVFEILQLSGLDPLSPGVSVAFRAEGRKQVGGREFRALSFTVSATGDPKAVAAFFRQMDGEQVVLQTLVVEKAVLTGGETSGSSVTLDFVVYTNI